MYSTHFIVEYLWYIHFCWDKCQNKFFYIPFDCTLNNIQRCITNWRIYMLITFVYCVYMNVLVWKSGCPTRQRLEESLPESILSFHRVKPWDWTHVVRLSDKHLYWLNYFARLWIQYFYHEKQNKAKISQPLSPQKNTLWNRMCLRQRMLLLTMLQPSCCSMALVTVHATAERWVLSL